MIGLRQIDVSAVLDIYSALAVIALAAILAAVVFVIWRLSPPCVADRGFEVRGKRHSDKAGGA